MPRASDGRYEIIDEPLPGRFSQISVSPVFPLLCFMLGGAWLGWLWIAINGYAFGSAHRRRELWVALTSPLVALALFLGIAQLRVMELLSEAALEYALLLVVVWKLGSMYWLFNSQLRSFALYQYFNGTVKNGAIVLVAAALLGRRLLEPLHPVLRAVLQ